MEITEVRIFPVAQSNDRLLAFATITFDHSFVVRDLRIIRGKSGVFVAMPSRRRNDGTYSDVAHPLVPELRQQIEEKVISEYHAEVERIQRVNPDYFRESALEHEGDNGRLPPGYS